MHPMKRVVFGVSGASGMPLAEAVLACLASISGLELHIVVSAGAELVLQEECGKNLAWLTRYGHAVYGPEDMAAPMASGSWTHDGMIICPCSMSCLGAITSCAGRDLLHRAADVTLKERRPLVLVPRETPLNLVHIRNMAAATEAGAIIMPFMPAFYTGNSSMQAAMRQFAGRILDILRIPNDFCARWKENGR